MEEREQLMADRLADREAVDAMIDEKLNAVVDGAVWHGERLGEPSPLTLILQVRGRDDVRLIGEGDTLLPASLSYPVPQTARVAPGDLLDAKLTASGSGLEAPTVVARAFYRNDSEEMRVVTVHCRVSQEEGCAADLLVAGDVSLVRPQWRFVLIPPQEQR
jgi:hypothetical protein